MKAPKVPLTHDGKKPYDPMHVLFQRMRGITGTLWARWQDEREYEDITDYAEPIQKALSRYAPGAKVVKMYKRPFGFAFTYKGKTWRYTATAKRSTMKSL